MELRLPALTDAEAEVIERYVRVLELLSRINPGGSPSTVAACERNAALLAAEAKALHSALVTMLERGEDELFPAVLSTVLRHLDAERHVARLAPAPDADRR